MKGLIATAGLLTALVFNGVGQPSSNQDAGSIHHPKIPTDALHSRMVPAEVMDGWAKVAWCETHGNWQFDGARYDGGLGIERGNWVHYGGTQFAPAPHLATPAEQIYIASIINQGHEIPDQNGYCEAW